MYFTLPINVHLYLYHQRKVWYNLNVRTISRSLMLYMYEYSNAVVLL